MPAMSFPTSGTVFSASIFDAGSMPLLTTGAAGSVLTLDILADGGVSPATFPADNSGAPSVVTLAAIPEPGTLGTFAAAMAGAGVLLALLRRRLRR